uniref:Uncharacterized protein n=2 Tax=Zea mays TaxID=4577 RepID=Q36874_MAIZE|nr:unknown protein [Zea mays]AAA70284.1 unknown protein [Zea mays]ABE98787.1 CMS-T pore-forming protein [Zea mays subsp. mays]
MITTFLNLPPFDQGLVFFGSIFIFFLCILLIKGYLRKMDDSYLAQLSELANHNRVEAAKAGHVALHELSFSWLRGVQIRVRTLPIQRNEGGGRSNDQSTLSKPKYSSMTDSVQVP